MSLPSYIVVDHNDGTQSLEDISNIKRVVPHSNCGNPHCRTKAIIYYYDGDPQKVLNTMDEIARSIGAETAALANALGGIRR